MKETISRKMTYIGAGVGTVLFAIFGILHGAFLGGAMGLSVAQAVLGAPLGAGVAARVLVGGSMLLGVMIAGIITVFGTSMLGWLLGTTADAVIEGKNKKVPVL